MDSRHANDACHGGRRALRAAPALACALLLLLAASCSKDDSPTAPVAATPASLVSEGWADFTGGRLAEARDEFTAAVALDPTYGPARLGLAWSVLALAGSRDAFQAAAAAFDAALAAQETTATTYAGRAAARLGLGDGDLPGAAADAGRVLAVAPLFTFSHDPDFDATDVRLLLAGAEAGRGDFVAALAAVQPDFPLVIAPDDPATWTVAGATHDSYAGAVGAWLQEIGAIAAP